MLKLGKYSFGIGDRFGRQGEAQLKAICKAKDAGVYITPVWNKSFREHQIIHCSPKDTRKKADLAVKKLNWQHDYFVDADHISLKNVDYFLDYSDFFTLDVAGFIGVTATEDRISEFIRKNRKIMGTLRLPGIDQLFVINEELLRKSAIKYLHAIGQAAKIYRHICRHKSQNDFVVEISMDETEQPQTPEELLIILAAIDDYGIPVNTIAPKFIGDFYKGVDYVGEVAQFEKEFELDLLVIQLAIEMFHLNLDVKLSVHTGSDKFSIYPAIHRSLEKHGAGVHIKTAGTTWLEELIGLAMAEGSGLRMAKRIYRNAFQRLKELCQPYATVTNIKIADLPQPSNVEQWDGKQFAATLRHDPNSSDFNTNFRQLLHVGYKIAAELDDEFYQALDEHKEIISQNVTENLFERHIKRIFF